MIRYIILVLILGAPACGAVGCAAKPPKESSSTKAEAGKEFDEGKVERIEDGKTKEAAVLAWFGEPNRKANHEDGRVQWIWAHSTAETLPDGNVKINLKMLQVFFQDGVVVEHGFGEASDSTEGN